MVDDLKNQAVADCHALGVGRRRDGVVAEVFVGRRGWDDIGMGIDAGA